MKKNHGFWNRSSSILKNVHWFWRKSSWLWNKKSHRLRFTLTWDQSIMMALPTSSFFCGKLCWFYRERTLATHSTTYLHGNKANHNAKLEIKNTFFRFISSYFLVKLDYPFINRFYLQYTLIMNLIFYELNPCFYEIHFCVDNFFKHCLG